MSGAREVSTSGWLQSVPEAAPTKLLWDEPEVAQEHARIVSVKVHSVQTGERIYDAISIVVGDLHLRCDAVDDRSIRLAKRLADDHQAWFLYDDHCAARVRNATGIKEAAE